jgi:hypothetical protein
MEAVRFCSTRKYIIFGERINWTCVPPEKRLVDLIEFVARRGLGPCATALSFLTLTPLGFSAKVLHLGARRCMNYIASTTFGKKVSQIWNNADLFGHALTSAPSKLYQFTTTPLSWHLHADGSDRRHIIYKSTPDGYVSHDAEYVLVPFELFEFTYRRILGGMLTGLSALASPLGLVAKSVHLATQSAFLKFHKETPSPTDSSSYISPVPQTLRELRMKSGRYGPSR